MRKQDGRSQERESLVKGLRDKLEWYTMSASDEEYDERAVESILYLLDGLAPLEDEEKPEPEEAWGRFEALVREREGGNAAVTAEINVKHEAVDEAEVQEEPKSLDTAEVSEKTKSAEAAEISGRPGEQDMQESLGTVGKQDVPKVSKAAESAGQPNDTDVLEETAQPQPEELGETLGKTRGHGKVKSRKRPKAVEILINGKEMEASQELGIPAGLARRQISVHTGAASARRMLHNLSENQKGAVRCNKYIVAAVLLLLVISAVGIMGNVHAGASPDTGFFHWLKRDNTGIQMITSPEDLDNDTDVKGVHTYFNREDVPEWAQGWLEIDDEFEMPDNYEWSRYEIEECRNFHKAASVYIDGAVNKESLLGMVMYYGEISFNTEELIEYKDAGSYEIEQKEISILSKTDDMGINYYLIYFFEGNCQYFMQGQDNLDELKSLMEQYWFYVKNNLEENEIICNKMLSQAIYK